MVEMEERSWTVANWVGERRRANWIGRMNVALVDFGCSSVEKEGERERSELTRLR